MLPNDVFRDRLERTLIDLEAWAKATADCAEIGIAASERYWRMVVVPNADLACPFELMIKSDQKFGLKLAAETYDDRPIERLDLFPAPRSGDRGLPRRQNRNIQCHDGCSRRCRDARRAGTRVGLDRRPADRSADAG